MTNHKPILLAIIVIFFIHMQIESPVESDMILSLYENLEGTSISPHDETTHPPPWRHYPAQIGTYVTFQEIAAVIPWKHEWTYNVIKHEMMIT